MASSSFNVSCGAALATTRVAWGGNTAVRSKVPWLPSQRVKIVNPDGTCNADWYRAFKWLFETALGGVAAQTVPQVASSVTAAQSEIVSTLTYAQQVSNYAQGVAARADAIAEVVTTNGLSGSGSIPPSPEPPPLPTSGERVG